jgi:hypothetical protein
MHQYDLAARALSLGWPRSAVRVIDEDLGVSGASAAGLSGFARLAAEAGGNLQVGSPTAGRPKLAAAGSNGAVSTPPTLP